MVQCATTNHFIMKSIFLKVLPTLLMLCFISTLSAQSIGTQQDLDDRNTIKYLSEKPLIVAFEAHAATSVNEQIELNEVLQVHGVTLIPTKFFVELMGKSFANTRTTYTRYIVTDTYSKAMLAAIRAM